MTEADVGLYNQFWKMNLPVHLLKSGQKARPLDLYRMNTTMKATPEFEGWKKMMNFMFYHYKTKTY